MRDDDAGDIDRSQTDSDGSRRASHLDNDMFGDFNVVGPGVHIVLDGRPVSHPSR